MRIGMVGAGRMGQALGRLFLRAGHDVRFANSRGAASLASLVAELGPGASACATSQLTAFAEVIVLATRWQQLPAATSALGDVEGRIVVDTTNNRFGAHPQDIYPLGEQTSSEVVALMLPGARVVKAFNNQLIAALEEWLTAGGPEARAVFLTGDDAAAKETISALISGIALVPIDAGTLRVGGRLMNTGGGPLAGLGRLLSVREASVLLAAVTRDGSVVYASGTAPD